MVIKNSFVDFVPIRRVLQPLSTLNTPALRKTSFLSYSTRQESKIKFKIKTCLQTCANQFCLNTIVRSST